MMGFIVPSSDATLKSLICGFQPWPSLPRWKQSSALPSYGLSLEIESGRGGAWDPGHLSPLSQQSCQKAVSRRHLRFLLFGKRRKEQGIVWGFERLGGACDQAGYLREPSPRTGTEELEKSRGYCQSDRTLDVAGLIVKVARVWV